MWYAETMNTKRLFVVVSVLVIAAGLLGAGDGSLAIIHMNDTHSFLLAGRMSIRVGNSAERLAGKRSSTSFGGIGRMLLSSMPVIFLPEAAAII